MLNRMMPIGLTRWRYLGLCISLLLSLACFWILLSKGLHIWGSILPAASCWS